MFYARQNRKLTYNDGNTTERSDKLKMITTTIEKVWAIQGLLFKNEDYQLALELEDSGNRVQLRYIVLNEDSPNYQINQEFGWNQSDFELYKSSRDAEENLLVIA